MKTAKQSQGAYSFLTKAVLSNSHSCTIKNDKSARGSVNNLLIPWNAFWSKSSINNKQFQQHRLISHSLTLLCDQSNLKSEEDNKSSGKRNRWTEEEDLEILRLAQLANRQQTWAGLPLPKDRTLAACSFRARLLHQQAGKDGAPLINRQSWIKTEEQLLIDVVAAIKREKIPWTYIQPVFFPNRSRESVWKEWYKIKPRVDSGELTANPPSKEIQAFVNDLKKKSIAKSTLWTAAEDECLVAAINSFGKSWKLVAKCGFKNINYSSSTDKSLTKKTASQCRTRWLTLDPRISRENWTSHEQSRLKEMVIQFYNDSFLELDINAIIERRANWPSDVKIPFGSVSKRLAAEGISRSVRNCSREWFNRSDPSLRDDEWTDEDTAKLKEIIQDGGTLRDACRQLHFSLSVISRVRDKIYATFEQESLSDEEQLKIVTAIYNLGQFHNRTIRRELPRRASRDINAFWRHNQLRLQRVVFDRSNADENTRKECSGKDQAKFLKYFSSLKMGKKDLRKIVDELKELKR